jgi:hypothetical protein
VYGVVRPRLFKGVSFPDVRLPIAIIVPDSHPSLHPIPILNEGEETERKTKMDWILALNFFLLKASFNF